MSFQYLDDPPTSPAPQAMAGYEFLDEPKGVTYLDGAPVPATAADIEARMSDLRTDPTPAEFAIWNKAKKEESWFQPGRWAKTAADAAGSTLSSVYQAAKQVPGAIANPGDLVQTILEAGGRGLLNDGDLVAKIATNAKNLIAPGTPNAMSLDDFMQSKLQEVQKDEFPTGVIRGKEALPPPEVPADTRKRWEEEYKTKYLPGIEYENFLLNRDTIRRAAARSSGQENVIPDVTGKAQNELADTLSMVTSPISVATFGAGAIPKAEVGAIAKGTAAAVGAAGRATSAVGRGAEWVGELPGRAAAAAFQIGTENPELAAKAQRIAQTGTIGFTLISPVVSVPLLSDVAIAAQAAKRGGQVMGVAGEAAQAAGRAIGDPILQQKGLLWNISKDGESPLWLRKAANMAQGLDPALSMIGRTAESVATGAAVGGAIGLAADGPEGAAAGVGSGAVLGAGFGTLGHLVGSSGIRTAAQDRDLARWLGSKSEAEVSNIQAMKLNRADALKIMETDVLARGMIGPEAGDVSLRFATEKEFKDQFGGIAKGAQLIEGDRPVVVINTGYSGSRTIFHEIGHALTELGGLDPQRQQIERLLFTQRTPDGLEVSRGVYSPEDLAEFRGQYVSRLPEQQRIAFNTLMPEEQAKRIRGEVVAESFANLLNGSPTGPLGRSVNSLRRRVADQVLLSSQASMLGRMRRALEAVGVKFNAISEPSEIFVKGGQPITNSPPVNAAIRQFLRAKQSIVRRLIASDNEGVTATVTPHDFLKKGNEGLVTAFKDWDGFARNPDGSVKMNGGLPVLLGERDITALQTKRAEAMIEALRKAPDAGELGAVREQDNGAWRGRRFTEAQLKALQALPDDVLSPSMKARLANLNELAGQPGNQILIDYNAALKGRRYSSGISATTRMAVPLTFNISKAGNFFMETLDTSHFRRKLGEWERNKKKAFEPWGGDVQAFMRDVFRYLDNHQNNRPGSVNLDPDPAAAVHKKNIINDFFNIHGHGDNNPITISSKNERDTMIRSRRFDRINRLSAGAGDAFPIDYYKLKANFLPAGARPTAGASISKQQIRAHVQAQAVSNFADRLTGPVVPAPVAEDLGQAYFRELNKVLAKVSGEDQTQRERRVARLVSHASDTDHRSIEQALVAGGREGAKAKIRIIALRDKALKTGPIR